MAALTNPYLAGNFAPVPDELTVTDLPVSGHLPEQLDGRYLRNGPNPVTAPEPSTYHWFTGDGMVHGIRLRDGRAEWYRNRWVRSTEVAAALGEPPHPGPIFADMDFASNTNVVGHAGKTFAIVEGGGRPYEMTAELETVGPSDFGGTLTGGYTAHPKRDPDTGELHAISYYWGWGNKVQYSVVGTDGRVRKAIDVECGGPVSVHDMSITERYAVIYDLPVVFNLEIAASGKGFPYRWDPDYRARVGLVARSGDTSDAAWFDVEPCYVFHPLNAYDDGNEVVLDVVRHPRMFDVNTRGPDEGTPTLQRWTLDLGAGKLREECIDDRGQEFPRVDERRVGRRHRYGYSVGVQADSSFLLKHDYERGTCERRALDGARPGEAVFVPRAPDATEDDGWVMSVVYDPARDASDLALVNAADFTGEPAAVVHLPRRVPFGFHGNWIPA